LLCCGFQFFSGTYLVRQGVFVLKSCEIFPPNYNVYRNDRGTLGGGVFILVEKSITSVEQTSFITDGEIEWVKVKMKNNKDLPVLVGSFYMPHREQKPILLHRLYLV
jgi:hypothetical protein